MGGLITCQAILKGESRIKKAWTLGTPYHGTHLIYVAYLYFFFLSLYLWYTTSSPWYLLLSLAIMTLPSLRQMHPYSYFLHQLKPHLLHLPNVQCVYSAQDQVSSKWAGWL